MFSKILKELSFLVPNYASEYTFKFKIPHPLFLWRTEKL